MEYSIIKKIKRIRPGAFFAGTMTVMYLRTNYDHLRIGLQLGTSDAERVESKQRINKLIREIDKCIALLDE